MRDSIQVASTHIGSYLVFLLVGLVGQVLLITTTSNDLPVDIVAEVHGNEQPVGQQGGFTRGRPHYQTQRHQEGRQLLNEPRQPGVHRESVPAGCIAPVRDVFKEQSHKRASCHDQHEVSHAVQRVALLFFRGEEPREERVHGGRAGRCCKKQQAPEMEMSALLMCLQLEGGVASALSGSLCSAIGRRGRTRHAFPARDQSQCANRQTASGVIHPRYSTDKDP